jgi:hypothetical protein
MLLECIKSRATILTNNKCTAILILYFLPFNFPPSFPFLSNFIIFLLSYLFTCSSFFLFTFLSFCIFLFGCYFLIRLFCFPFPVFLFSFNWLCISFVYFLQPLCTYFLLFPFLSHTPFLLFFLSSMLFSRRFSVLYRISLQVIRGSLLSRKEPLMVMAYVSVSLRARVSIRSSTTLSVSY